MTKIHVTSSLIDPLSEDDEEDNLEEDYSDSDEYSPETDEEVPDEVTDTRNEPAPSTSNKSFGFHRTGRVGLCGGYDRVPFSFFSFQPLPLLRYHN